MTEPPESVTLPLIVQTGVYGPAPSSMHAGSLVTPLSVFVTVI